MVRELPGLRWAIALAMVLVLPLSACGDRGGPQLARLPSDARIVAFGDSLTFGTGAKQSESYPAVLGELTGLDVINLGHPGDETRHGLEKLPAVLDSVKPDLLILCLGGNDFLRKRPAATIRANLEQLIREARSRGVPTVLLGVPEPAIIAMDAHPMYAELAREHKLVLENDVLSKVLSDGSTKSDLIHPNARGYRIVAEAVHDLLRRKGAI